jgi:hypothetical protein
MKIEQKIAAGGSKSTNTPMFRLRMKVALLAPLSEARHIEHWARLGETTARTTAIENRTRKIVR